VSLRWEDLEPQKYENMVSVLLSRLHPDSQRIDGKGGDGGRDVQIVHTGDGSIADAFRTEVLYRLDGFAKTPTSKALP
jgi:hypothetical protein